MDDTRLGMPDLFDRTVAQFHGRPDVVNTKATHIRSIPTLGVGGVQTFVVQTYRAATEGARSRDTIFLECYDGPQGHVRLVLNAEVADAIARQRDALTAKARSKAAKQKAADRKARGEVPGFLKRRKVGG